ncbi:MAG: type II toxin-antitoxin system VapC family toxin, partial [Candidatus Aenigmarchaeota archaeon]|nr:type II toxin-antitoxin system VapC family toxin [Candidatus Aenigmarchaeota archaeon]
DANVFLSAILYEDEEGHMAKEFLGNIAEGKQTACTSVLTWDEIVWSVKKVLGIEEARKEGKKFIEFPNMKFVPADSIIISDAQNLMEKYPLKPRDSIHAATALSCGAAEIISDDPDFDAVKELKRIPVAKM